MSHIIDIKSIDHVTSCSTLQHTQRIEYIDTLKGVGIFLVFLGHLHLHESNITKYIYSFHIPLFFFISGMFFKHSDVDEGIAKFAVKKFRTRIIPYVSFGLITYLIWLFPILLKKYTSYRGLSPVPDNLIRPLVGMIYGNDVNGWISHNYLLWFLACLVMTEFIFFIIYPFTRTIYIIPLLSIMSVIGYFDSIYLDFRLPFSLDVAFTAVVFYGLGFILNNSIFLKSVNMYAALICLIIGMLCGYINDRVDMDTMHYGNFFLFYASSISSIYAFIQISKYIPNIKLISYVGKNSLSFFLLQNPAFLFFSMLIYSISRIRVSSCEFTLAYACGYALLSMLLLFPASYIINNKIPIITGKIN